VIMFELTGEVEYIPPFMIAILTAKLVVDALHEEGVNDHTVLGEYLDHELAARIAQRKGGLARDLIPSTWHMDEMTLIVGSGSKIMKHDLTHRLHRMRRHGFRDAALVLIDEHEHLEGIISEAELDFALHEKDLLPDDEPFDVLHGVLAGFVDRSPLIIKDNAALEMVVEMFYELGLRHAVIVEEGSSKVVGVVLKQQLMVHLEKLRTG
jgi:chloride channel 3/4/5